mgnify:CR=1 FL=1
MRRIVPEAEPPAPIASLSATPRKRLAAISGTRCLDILVGVYVQ